MERLTVMLLADEMLRARNCSVKQRPQLLHLRGCEYLHRLAILAVFLKLYPQRDFLSGRSAG
jgi:hypothetical protein